MVQEATNSCLCSLCSFAAIHMRSVNADIFNHDEEADGYDADVRNESDPIRAGYDELLNWVINEARITATSRVLELGSGTGNLSCRIPACRELVCVDLSERMEAIARPKLAHISNRRFIKADLLEVFQKEIGLFDSIISTYTIHHLTDEEKRRLFAEIYGSLVPGGRAVFGDLMLQGEQQKVIKIREYRALDDFKTVEALQEEFFWMIDATTKDLNQLGFQVETRRFSDLSWGLRVRLRRDDR
jgi:putative AdoMet-dependent methyltransferase